MIELYTVYLFNSKKLYTVYRISAKWKCNVKHSRNKSGKLCLLINTKQIWFIIDWGDKYTILKSNGIQFELWYPVFIYKKNIKFGPLTIANQAKA